MASTIFRIMIEQEEKKNEIPIELTIQKLFTSLAQRVRIQGELGSEELKFANPFTGRTPARNSKMKYEMEDPSIPQEIQMGKSVFHVEWIHLGSALIASCLLHGFK